MDYCTFTVLDARNATDVYRCFFFTYIIKNNCNGVLCLNINNR